jgi:salicylate hydroxylase
MEPPKTDTVAVVGGGIGGIVLTLGLVHQQIPVTLYESAAKFGEIGAGVAFGPNAARAMELIDPKIRQAFEKRRTMNQWESHKNRWFDFRYGVGKKMGQKEAVVARGEWRDDLAVDADGVVWDNSRIGDHIFSFNTPPGRGTVHRAHFLDEMVELLPEGISHFGKRLVDLHDEGPDRGVVLTFADGSKVRHTAVVGTDGIRSRTRELLLGESHPAAKPVFTGKYAYRGLIPMQDAVKLLGEELASNSQMYTGYHGHLLTFPIEKGKTMNGT